MIQTQVENLSSWYDIDSEFKLMNYNFSVVPNELMKLYIYTTMCYTDRQDERKQPMK